MRAEKISTVQRGNEQLTGFIIQALFLKRQLVHLTPKYAELHLLTLQITAQFLSKNSDRVEETGYFNLEISMNILELNDQRMAVVGQIIN